MEIYFDNSATTKVLDSVKDLVVKMMTEDYGNPSARHRMGAVAERRLTTAREEIAATLKASEKEIIFTSGGSESNNMALVGAAMANQRSGKHILTSSIEHPSVYNTTGFLEELGFSVTYLPVDNRGSISLEELEKAIRPDTVLVSIMYVNNEIGAVEPIDEIAALVRRKNQRTLFHVDAIQAYGKYLIRPKRQGIDLLSVSGHKIHGPKGVGFLYVGEKVKIKPIILGGGQQKGLRSGTENVPGAAGLGAAAREAYTNFEEKVGKLCSLKDRMLSGLNEVVGVSVNSAPGEESAPHIVSAGFEGVRSEVLLHALEDRGIYVSSGSACSSNHPSVSGTLKGIGVRPEFLDSTIRISFGIYNTAEEVDECLGVLKEILPALRRYQRS